MPRTLIAECKIDGTSAYSFVDLDKARQLSFQTIKAAVPMLNCSMLFFLTTRKLKKRHHGLLIQTRVVFKM